MRDNPIPALLRQADGRGPREIGAEWADAAMRAHRRAGRADLALTLRANLARLDALRAFPAIAVVRSTVVRTGRAHEDRLTRAASGGAAPCAARADAPDRATGSRRFARKEGARLHDLQKKSLS